MRGTREVHVGGHLETRRGDARHRAVLSEERRHRDGNVRASGKDEGVGGARARTRRMYANSAASSSLRRGGDVCDVSMDRTIFASAPRAAISEGGRDVAPSEATQLAARDLRLRFCPGFVPTIIYGSTS